MGSLVPIHVRHIAVHKNELIITKPPFILFNISFYRIHSHLPIENFVTDAFRVYVAMVFEDDLQSFNIILLIINDQDSTNSLLEMLDNDIVLVYETDQLSPGVVYHHYRTNARF